MQRRFPPASLAALNGTDQDQPVPFIFPSPGDYREELHGQLNLTGLFAGEEERLTIPSKDGCIRTRRIAA